ncbi:MAG TPA: 3,4-dihydroxy-2-butanone-4-phosphate synthase, partial [Actinomycetota bacterium]|nr:3,4-dihydroxy-2-butanone-4-phosphate synthase [Actinomycetota bacterium]
MPLARIEEAIEAIRNGRMVIVVDDEDRENEGDLIFAAEKATSEMVTFMVRHCSGIICVPLESDRLDDLHLPLMAPNHTDALGTAFTVSVDSVKETTTGISAADRARTVEALI